MPPTTLNSEEPDISTSLNESPSEKEGKFASYTRGKPANQASMKALPKRKGNAQNPSQIFVALAGLNESPSEKEGKSCHTSCTP